MTKKDIIWKLAYLAIAGGVFLIDQTSKAWATRSLRFGGDQTVISGFLNFAYAQNPGVAFSMLDDHGDSGRWALSAVAIVAATLVLFFFWRTPRTDDRIMGALALLLAGIVGNVTDRIRLGFVDRFCRCAVWKLALSDVQCRRCRDLLRSGALSNRHVFLKESDEVEENQTDREYVMTRWWKVYRIIWTRRCWRR